jgi:lysozyme
MTPLRINVVFAAAALFLGCTGIDQKPASNAESNGIDVSHFQGNVDWKKVAASGISFAFVKATQGAHFTDPKFKENWAGTRAAGVLRGAYHFLDPSVDGKKQAAHFLATAKLGTGDLLPAVDVEKIGAGGAVELRNNLMAFLAEVHKVSGHHAIIYISPAFWNEHIAAGTKAPWKNPLWVAEYGVSKPRTIDGLPSWSIWQHSRKGSVSGIEGKVDLDKARDIDRLKIR